MTAKKILALLIAFWLTVSFPVNVFAVEHPSETTVEGTETLPEAEKSPSEEATLRSQTDSGTCGDNLTWTLDADGTLTISGTGEMSGDPWNPYRSDIKKVVIESGVTSIGDYAFRVCTSLTSVTIPESVRSIDDCAFQSCSGLTSVTIPQGVTSIGSYAFEGCAGLTSVTIPESVRSISVSAFSWCSNLTEILVAPSHSNYVSVDGALFNRSMDTLLQFPGGKQGAYFIPESTTTIGDGAFAGCSSLTSVTIPDSVTSIGDAAFLGCSGLTSVIIPDSITSIGDATFMYCSGLTNVTIPQSVTSFFLEAFSGCSSLTNVVIPDSVTYISGYVFRDCSSLTSVTIPQSLATLDKGKHDKQQQNGLSTLPKTPPGCKKGGVFA